MYKMNGMEIQCWSPALQIEETWKGMRGSIMTFYSYTSQSTTGM